MKTQKKYAGATTHLLSIIMKATLVLAANATFKAYFLQKIPLLAFSKRIHFNSLTIPNIKSELNLGVLDLH